MTRTGRAITLSLKEPDKESLQAIAIKLGCTWGDKPNISKLLEAIAQHELLITKNNDWPQEMVESLYQAMLSLRECGDIERVRVLANLLLSRSELNPSQRNEIERLFEATQKPKWRKLLDEFLEEEQPFQISYQDAAQRIWTFNIQFAEIVRRDRREYLECWCKETNKDAELTELKNNWILSLDRIGEAMVAPIKAKWKPGLDSVPAELQFYGTTAFSYEGHGDDVSKEWRDQALRVVRKISDPSSLYREMLLYAEDAVIQSPPKLRDGFLLKLQKLSDRYD